MGNRTAPQARRARRLGCGGAAVPLTEYQAGIARLLSENRSFDSYLAGGAAILIEPNTTRYSRDLDYFHDSEVRVADAIRGETIQFAMDSELVPPLGQWANYPLTVARRLVRNFPGATRGARIALASDLPPAAGMSSSSALMVAIALALADANDIWSHERFLPELNEPLNLAGYLATIENGQSYGPLAGDRGEGVPVLRRFALLLGLGTTGGLAVIALIGSAITWHFYAKPGAEMPSGSMKRRPGNMLPLSMPSRIRKNTYYWKHADSYG